MMRLGFTLPVMVMAGLVSHVALGEESDFRVHADAEVILEDDCFSGHEDGTEKGDIRLDHLEMSGKKLDQVGAIK